MSNVTPNVVIENSTVRKVMGVILYSLAVLSGAASIVLSFWPELSGYGVDVTRIISTANALISFFSGIFGFAVTIPNVPKASTAPAVTTIKVGD